MIVDQTRIAGSRSRMSQIQRLRSAQRAVPMVGTTRFRFGSAGRPDPALPVRRACSSADIAQICPSGHATRSCLPLQSRIRRQSIPQHLLADHPWPQGKFRILPELAVCHHPVAAAGNSIAGDFLQLRLYWPEAFPDEPLMVCGLRYPTTGLITCISGLGPPSSQDRVRVALMPTAESHAGNSGSDSCASIRCGVTCCNRACGSERLES